MYGASEKEEYIAEQASQLKIRNVSLCFLACIVVLTLFILWRLWRFNHIIEYKNRMLAKLINEKFANKKMVISYWKCTRNRRFHQNWNRN